ncbi:hypothetical protein ACS0TY_034917 [Phlomoides rotata]
MEPSKYDSIITRVRHLRENVAELQKEFDQLILNVKVSGTIQQANLDNIQNSIHGVRYTQHQLWFALEGPLLRKGSQFVTQKEIVQQAEPPRAFQVPEPGKADSAYTSFSSKEKGQQAEPSQGVPVIEPGQAITASTSSFSNLEETEHQTSKPDVSDQPGTSGVKEGEINLRPQKGTKLVDTNIAGTKSC